MRGGMPSLDTRALFFLSIRADSYQGSSRNAQSSVSPGGVQGHSPGTGEVPVPRSFAQPARHPA